MTTTHQLLCSQAKIRIGEESISRIIKCLDMLTDEQIWFHFNNSSNSIGNLILHLEGNSTQWILHTFAGIDDNRNRDTEFAHSEIIPRAQLKQRLLILQNKLYECIDSITEAALLEVHDVQCYRESGVSIVVHVIEHFSYHTGQIAFITKLLLDKQTHFYEGVDLNEIG